ncbi:MAG: ubiquinone biosynthesis protein UbiE [Halochromatium sp.]|nr:ubiquinone biosynthesis protein UbiE [Halochromatium sp.]
MSDPQRAFFDERAEGWEQRCYPAETRARLADLVDGLEFSEVSTLLDLGAGTGVLYPDLRRALGPSTRILALDISHAMLRQGADKPWQPGDLRIQGTALALPLADASLDMVLCFAAFPHFSDSTQALTEMARVTRRGGQVVIAHLMSRDELREHHGRHHAVARDLLPTEAEMQDLFARAGMSSLEINDRPGLYLARGIAGCG